LIPVLHGTLLVLPPRLRAPRRENKMTVKIIPNDKGMDCDALRITADVKSVLP
jgi:hypothetical protein